MNSLPLSSNAMQRTNPASQLRPRPFNALANYGVLQQQGRSGPGPTRQCGQSRVRNSCLYHQRRQGNTASNRNNNKPTSKRYLFAALPKLQQST
jgi:hypothetical protein